MKFIACLVADGWPPLVAVDDIQPLFAGSACPTPSQKRGHHWHKMFQFTNTCIFNSTGVIKISHMVRPESLIKKKSKTVKVKLKSQKRSKTVKKVKIKNIEQVKTNSQKQVNHSNKSKQKHQKSQTKLTTCQKKSTNNIKKDQKKVGSRQMDCFLTF